jgi:hypothetical protein
MGPLENKTLNSGAKAAARSRFEGTKQRFFAQVLLSLKLPSIYPAIDEHLASGRKRGRPARQHGGIDPQPAAQ